jgi:eukaryotic-like serine/threonine-protein kinase
MAITPIDMSLPNDTPGKKSNGVVPPELVNAQLQAISRSAALGTSPRLQKLLDYLVSESLAGNPLKESIVGVAVFGRSPDYDPKQDSIVRTEARRLRAKLIEYYAGDGAADRIVIDLPKGSYVPAFRYLTNAEAPTPPEIPSSTGSTASDLKAGIWSTRNRIRLAVAGMASLLLVVSAVLVTRQLLRKPGGTALAASPRRSVAVLDFRNLAGRPETGWLSSAIPEMIGADLADGQRVRMIPGENVARMEAELSLPPAASPSRETLAGIRRNLGADIVVSGAYADLGAEGSGRMRVDIWAEDTQTGEVVASVSESGADTEILDVMSRAGTRLRSGLGLESAPSAETALRDSSPHDPGTARAYADALALMRRGNLLQARDLLRQCIKTEPGFAPALSALSSADAKLGYEALAREEAKQAFDSSRSMRSEESKLAIEAQFHEANQEPARAVEVYSRLFAWHPDDIEYGLQLAAAQRMDNKIDEALRTLDGLRKLPGIGASDSRIDMEAAQALATRSDYRQSALFAAEAARKADAANAKLLYARAVSFESGLNLYFADERWRRLSEEARKICEQFQDKACVATILRRFGNVSLVKLDLDSADRYYAQALAIAHEIGSAAEECNVLNGMALVSAARGDPKKSAAIQERLLAIGRRTQSPHLEQQSLNSLGDLLLNLGEVEAAKEKLEAATKIARGLGVREALADDLASLADLYRVHGDLARALPLCQEALTNAREAGAVYSQVTALTRMARILLAAGDLDGARKALDEYNRLRNGEHDMSILSDWTLPASVALAGHNPAEAVALSDDAIRQTSAHRLPWEQAHAEALLAESLFAEGEQEKARSAAEEAWTAQRDSQWRLARLEIGIAYARVTGRTEELNRIIAEAHSTHAFQPELEARLARADLAHDAAERAAVHADALSHGYLYLARLSDKQIP